LKILSRAVLAAGVLLAAACATQTTQTTQTYDSGKASDVSHRHPIFASGGGQITLNDPNHAGGSDALNVDRARSFVSGTTR
jgi:hypothetical protein